ncbi:hypothetical protein OOU_Y34scaffold00203g53 [Pyricularia oryzae Y34]|uniref:Uncharacterized protein n=3 Tax=Pyricularia oryzae TaxID=318829 RepID=A0A4P7NL39_PYROR|nr:hypothetical protein OOU_Y34scaffold00203g53 [Pyricularia oryzae Y34]QBZ62847.1 hypothetical protein PoMZ_11734 [Pyricularia oryzae]
MSLPEDPGGPGDALVKKQWYAGEVYRSQDPFYACYPFLPVT